MWREKSLVILLLCVGCLSPQLPGRRDEQPDILSRAVAAIERDDWDDAAVLIGRFLRDNPGHPAALRARYLLGTYYLKAHELEAAEREFDFVAAHAAPSPLARQARLRIGDVALAAREYNRAAEL